MLRKADRTYHSLWLLFGAISVLSYFLRRVDSHYLALGAVALLLLALVYVIHRIIKEWNVPPELRP